jgi:hypothetical protein
VLNGAFATVPPQLAHPERFDRVEKRLTVVEWVTDMRGYGRLRPGVHAKPGTVIELTKRRR